MSDQKFMEAVTLVKAGDHERGQKLLMRIVRQNPYHERAWLWLVNTTPKKVNQIGCLERVLAINPENETALRILDELKNGRAISEIEENEQEPIEQEVVENVSILPPLAVTKNEETNEAPVPTEAVTKIVAENGVYEFEVDLVVSKARGALGKLFSKKTLSRSILKIAPEVGLLQVKGVDLLVQNEQYNLYFHDIVEVYSPGDSHLTIRLQNGKEIQFKDVKHLNQILMILSPLLPKSGAAQSIATPQPEAQMSNRPPKPTSENYEQRISQLI